VRKLIGIILNLCPLKKTVSQEFSFILFGLNGYIMFLFWLLLAIYTFIINDSFNSIWFKISSILFVSWSTISGLAICLSYFFMTISLVLPMRRTSKILNPHQYEERFSRLKSQKSNVTKNRRIVITKWNLNSQKKKLYERVALTPTWFCRITHSKDNIGQTWMLWKFLWWIKFVIQI